MNKELTPLEALEELRQNNKDDTHLFDSELLDIIEIALKDYEKRLILAKEYQDINNVAKRLKALEIIKEIDKTSLLHFIAICVKDQDKYDLLKEVLL